MCRGRIIIPAGREGGAGDGQDLVADGVGRDLSHCCTAAPHHASDDNLLTQQTHKAIKPRG